MAVSEPLRKNVTPVRVVALEAGARSERADALATEEPMEIRAHGPGQEAVRVAVTMRTPGGDFELAVGFLFTEGLIQPGDVRQVAYCDDVDTEEQRYNVITVALAESFDETVLHRNFFATSSCGVCGKAALEDVEVRCPPIPLGFTVPVGTIVELPDRLRSAQRVFDRTGGLHAAGLFSGDGELVSIREDVGRHNAID
jgi:FdhD protein